MGRPKTTGDQKLHDSALYQLLMDKLPSEFIKYDKIDTQRLSAATGNARYTIYCWLNERRTLSKRAIQSLLEISRETDDPEKKGALTKEDLIPFALGF
ncbi:hypothetical protein BFN67_04740 [Pseudaminobacter manganicus]|uniref:Uncharacterized protein n=2 Tax=Manganibacter manganicus TaxID=1873176 RepID=A0A1V8RP06_9HYPH|nr:hypothetical protein BFN67_04740 [Pseudaminobacter manganicus]